MRSRLYAARVVRNEESLDDGSIDLTQPKKAPSLADYFTEAELYAALQSVTRILDMPSGEQLPRIC